MMSFVAESRNTASTWRYVDHHRSFARFSQIHGHHTVNGKARVHTHIPRFTLVLSEQMFRRVLKLEHLAQRLQNVFFLDGTDAFVQSANFYFRHRDQHSTLPWLDSSCVCREGVGKILRRRRDGRGGAAEPPRTWQSSQLSLDTGPGRRLQQSLSVGLLWHCCEAAVTNAEAGAHSCSEPPMVPRPVHATPRRQRV